MFTYFNWFINPIINTAQYNFTPLNLPFIFIKFPAQSFFFSQEHYKEL